jgi:hypothetical protein
VSLASWKHYLDEERLAYREKDGYHIPEFEIRSPKVQRWWDSKAKIRILSGANRSGKSITLGAKVLQIAREKEGSLSWMITLSFEMSGIIWKLMEKYLDPSEIYEPVWGNKRLAIPKQVKFKANDAIIQFKSQEQGFLKFEAAEVDGAIAFDEEVLSRQLLSSALRATTGTGAPVLMALTPLQGKTFIYHDFFKKADGEFIFAETLELRDNKFLREEDFLEAENFYSESEKPYRLYGKWGILEGRIYRIFNTDRHCVPFSRDIVSQCHTIIRGIDFGRWKACVWLGITDDDKVYQLYEWKKDEVTIKQMAEEIKAIDRFLRREPTETVTDHAFQERFELDNYGIYCKPAKKSIKLGIEITARRFEDESLQLCDCPQTEEEIENYVWGKDGKPAKGQDDHLVDCQRYALVEAEDYCQYKYGMIPELMSACKSEVEDWV